MKKKWVIGWIIVAFLGATVLSGTAIAEGSGKDAFVFRPYSDAEYAKRTGQDVEIETETEEKEDNKDIIFVGDSRVVGMASMVGGYYYIAKTSQGYDWLVNTALAETESAMAEYPDAPVVFCLGVNDLGDVDAYIDCYQDFMDQYPEKDIYFLSVTPVDNELAASDGYSVQNDQIVAFNDALQEAFPDQYLDLYYYMQVNGFLATDGVHYDGNTYAMIQDYVRYMVLNG